MRSLPLARIPAVVAVSYDVVWRDKHRGQDIRYMETGDERVNQTTYRDRGTKPVELPRCRAVGPLDGAELTPEVCGKKSQR